MKWSFRNSPVGSVTQSITAPFFKFLFNDPMSSNIIHGSNGSSTPIEPFEPRLTSLPPELASQLMAARYIAVASLSVSWCLLPIGLQVVNKLCSDIHLGNFNQHRPWLRSPLRASVTLTNCYLFHITASLLFFCCNFLYSFIYCQRLCCLGFGIISVKMIRSIRELRFSHVYFITNLSLSFFFSNIFEFNVCLDWKNSDRFLLFHCGIHLSPYLLPHSSRVQYVSTGSRIFCTLVADCSGRMLGFHHQYFSTDYGETPILSPRGNQFFCSGGNYHSPGKRHSCFPGYIMAFIPNFLRS